MAVYKRSYKGYGGGYTARWSRFLILTQYSLRGIFKSRILTGLFVICFFYPLVNIALLYLNHNAQVLSMLNLQRGQILDIGPQFFMIFMSVQGSLAFIMTAFIGPNMIAPDLANGALPVYFCRPLSRPEYVFGKACAILLMLSVITWVPGLIVFLIEASLAGPGWAWDHINFAGGLLLGGWLWISVLTLLALALSAWVKWKLVAGALILGVLFMTSGFAAAVNGILRTKVGWYLDPAALVTAIYANTFGVEIDTGITVPGACVALILICSFCAYLLQKKVRAFEVVK
jgi:ABC-2 type transport system permease protein